MKKLIPSTSLIFLIHLFLIIRSTDAVGQGIAKQVVDKRIIEAAKGTMIDSSVFKASQQRDSIAAEKLKNQYYQTKKEKNAPTILEQREISNLLILDNNQPELHVEYAESYSANLKKYLADGTSLEGASEQIEAIWQESEWFKLHGLPEELKDRFTSLLKGLPQRPSKDTILTKEILSEARKTFQSGKGIYIYYPLKKPIEFKTGQYVMNTPTTYIRYIRSPKYPPSACRVVTYIYVNDGTETKPSGFHQGYEGCVFPTGLLKSFYLTSGNIKLQPETKLFIHVESLFDGKEEAIISNTIEIPIIIKQ